MSDKTFEGALSDRLHGVADDGAARVLQRPARKAPHEVGVHAASAMVDKSDRNTHRGLRASCAAHERAHPRQPVVRLLARLHGMAASGGQIKSRQTVQLLAGCPLVTSDPMTFEELV